DPLGGSFLVESLTDRLEEEAMGIVRDIDARGGAVSAIESGWMQGRIADSAYRQQVRIESGQKGVVGVNQFRDETSGEVEVMRIEPRSQEEQIAALIRLRAERDNAAVELWLGRLEECARGTSNLMPVLKEALARYATIGECCQRLRLVFGEYLPPDAS
ncbi:MAG: methylmalonyl-CoA mutase family protein, partial [Candidatus Dormibacteraceae bacterium]